MLILTRRAGESLQIGADVKVTILRITGNQVRVGICAPKGIAVDREEVHQRKHGEATSVFHPTRQGAL